MPICRDGLSLSSSLLIWPPSLFNNDDLTSYGECVALPSLSSLKLNTVDCPLSCSAQMLFLLSYQIRTRQHPRTSSVASFLSLRLDGCVLFDDLNFKIRAFFGNFLIFKFKFEIFFISFERKKKKKNFEITRCSIVFVLRLLKLIRHSTGCLMCVLYSQLLYKK